MNGVNIFLHAVRMVLGNLSQALRIGLVPQIVLVLASTLFAGGLTGADVTDPSQMGAAAGGGLVMMVLSILIAIWMAVSWHRYVMLEEQPGPFLPGWNGGAIWEYFKVAVILAILLIILAIPLGFVGGIVAAAVTSMQSPFMVAVVIAIIVGLPVTWLGYRLSPALVGAAVEQKLSLGDAWGATGRGAGDILVLTVVSIVASLIVQVPMFLLAGAGFLVNVVLQIAIGWVVTMVGAAVITTIYGVYVQGRSVDA